MKDLHYGWIVVGIGTSIIAMHSLTVTTFGIFLRPMTVEFGWDRGALSGAFSVSFLLNGFLGIFSGRLSDKYGPRILVTLGGLFTGIGLLLLSYINSLWQVYLIWGLFMGVGASCCLIPIISTIPRWFETKKGIAIAITTAGVGLGGILWPILVQYFISSYGWRQSFLISGLITLIIIIPLAQFMKHSPQRAGLQPYGWNRIIPDEQSLASASGLSLTQAIKTGPFWILIAIHFCFLFCVQLIMVHIVPYAVDVGVLPILAASILSIMAGIGVIGRLSMGFISDKIGSRLVLIACFALVTLALIWLLFTGEIWGFYLFAVVFGLAWGGITTVAIIVTTELFGISALGVILGSFLFFGAIGGAIGTPLAGTIFDITGGYSSAFLICVVVSALAVILSLGLMRYKGKQGVGVSN